MKNKKIIIETNDIKEMYRKYKKYKSIRYKKTEFVYKGKNEDIKEIINVLNQKTRMKRLVYIYDKSCDQIDKKFEGKNICGFECNKCMVQRKYNLSEQNGCCRICKFQSSNGCTTKNITCKLFFCDEVKKQNDIVELKDLNLVKLLTRRQRVILKFDLFSLREEVLMDLYIGFITIAAFRELWMLIRISLFLLFKKKDENKKIFSVKRFVILITILILLFLTITNPLGTLIIICIGMIEALLAKIHTKMIRQC